MLYVEINLTEVIMTVIDKNIIESYSDLFEGLSYPNKEQLIERLKKSLKVTESKENNFYKSFGLFSSEKTAEQIISEIKFNRKFKNTKLNFD